MSDDNQPTRHDRAMSLVKRFSAVAVAPALIPLPLVDVGLITAVQVAMVHRLARLYDVPFSRQRTVALVSALVGGTASVSVGVGFARLVPVLGKVTAPVAIGGLGAASTWAVGQVFGQHFESGGTFLTFDPDRVRAHYEKLMASRQAPPSADRPSAPRKP